MSENTPKTSPRIHIIGGANIDICGASAGELVDRDSNIGKISIRFGGVGRNIAQTAAELGAPVHFVTCFGADEFGRLLREDCERRGMDCSRSVERSDYPTSVYLAMLERGGDMHIGMSDMRILEAMEEAMLDAVLEDVEEEDYLVIDSNLDPTLIRHVAENNRGRLVSDPVSAAKADRLADVIPGLAIFKPNALEAERLSGLRLSDADGGKRMLEYFLAQGVEEVLITMADRGVLLGTAEGRWRFRHQPPEMHNATGAGDAFLGAYLAARREKETPRAATRFAIGAAVVRIETVNADAHPLSRERIVKRCETLQIEEESI